MTNSDAGVIGAFGFGALYARGKGQACDWVSRGARQDNVVAMHPIIAKQAGANARFLVKTSNESSQNLSVMLIVLSTSKCADKSLQFCTFLPKVANILLLQRFQVSQQFFWPPSMACYATKILDYRRRHG